MIEFELERKTKLDLQKAMRSLPTKIRKRVARGANRKGTAVIAKQARRNAPVRRTEGMLEEAKFTVKGEVRFPGNLKKAIRVKTTRLPASDKKFAVSHFIGFKDKTAAMYGKAYELGNQHQPARPFVRPAFDAVEGKAGQVIEEALWAGIKKAWDK